MTNDLLIPNQSTYNNNLTANSFIMRDSQTMPMGYPGKPFKRRQEELDRKAAELDRREQQLQGNMPQLNNWPPLPDNFCLKPCFYQDFSLEIPPEFQRLIKHLYYTWMCEFINYE
ncbi:hypothetical protein GQX74_010187 [Glossina fuscipes]|nr:hypothetical protein GQX74_010187 [Glossina fuscipes]